jgi:hypothetical protein
MKFKIDPSQIDENCSEGAKATLNENDKSARESQGRWIRARQLPEIFCSWDLAYRCTLAGWLKPIIKGRRRTIYRVEDVLNCMRRIEAGELPPSRTQNKSL